MAERAAGPDGAATGRGREPDHEHEQRGGLERVMLLRTFPAFAELAPGHLAALAELAVERSFPAGSEIHPEGLPVREVHYVLTGEVAIRRRGQEVRRLGPRSVIGGLAALARLRDGYQVITTADTTTFSFTHEDQVDVFEDNFEMMTGVLRGVAGAYIDDRRRAGTAAGFEGEPDPGVMPAQPLGLVGKLAVLRRTTPFDLAEIEALAELARDSPERRHPAGTTLWRTGDPAGHSLLVVAGVIEGHVPENGQRFRLGARSIAGGLDSLAERPRWFDATAASELAVLEVGHAALLDVLEDHTGMAMDVLRAMAGGVLALRERKAAGQAP